MDTNSSSDPGFKQGADEQREALSALRRFAGPRPQVERCELCSAALAEVHPHLLDQQSRQITCACDACAILFCGQEGGKFLRIPRRIKRLEDFRFSDLEWESMTLPINLAFFLSSPTGKMIAMYPSPAGAIESQIDLAALEQRTAEHPILRGLEPEVEALLVNRIGDNDASFVVPLDECYRLVGLVRMKWSGLSGGSEVWNEINGFFLELEAKAVDNTQVRYA